MVCCSWLVRVWQIGVWYIYDEVVCVMSIVVRMGSSRLLVLVSFSEIIVEVSGVWVMLVRQVYMFSIIIVVGFIFGSSVVRLWLMLVFIVSVGENSLFGMLVVQEIRLVVNFISLNLCLIRVWFCIRFCVCLQLVLNVLVLNIRLSSVSSRLQLVVNRIGWVVCVWLSQCGWLFIIVSIR